MDLLELDRRALASTGALVEATEDHDLGLPTPCEDWDVRSLLDHVIGGNRLFAAAATQADPDWRRRAADHVGGDHRRAYRDSCEAVTAAFEADGVPAASFELPFGVLPGYMAIAIHFVDVLVHGWDLAVAIGREPRLDAELCLEALRIAESYPEETWGDPRFFAARVEPRPDMAAQERLVAFLGRRPVPADRTRVRRIS